MDINDLLDENERIRIDSPEKLEVYIQTHHERFHKLLLWSYSAILLNIIIVMVRIVNVYQGTGQMYPLITAYAILTCIYAGFLLQQWRSSIDLGDDDAGLIHTLLWYKIGVAQKEIGMIAGYLVTYSLTLGAGFIFYKATGLITPNEVFKTTSIITLFMGTLGIYSLIKALVRRHRLYKAIKTVGDREPGRRI